MRELKKAVRMAMLLVLAFIAMKLFRIVASEMEE